MNAADHRSAARLGVASVPGAFHPGNASRQDPPAAVPSGASGIRALPPRDHLVGNFRDGSNFGVESQVPVRPANRHARPSLAATVTVGA